jgi:type I restriction enzyme S subunit
MFGDPGAANLRWPRLTLSEVAHQVTDGEHITPAREADGIKLLSARNIQDGFIDFSKVDYVSPAEYARISRRCNPQPGDILLSCSGTIGRVALIEIAEPLSLVRSVALIKPNHEMIASNYLLNVLRMPALRNSMLRAANTSSQANLFQGPIRALPIPVPPIALQQKFSRRFRNVTALQATQTEDSRALDELFESLQASAFRNEL